MRIRDLYQGCDTNNFKRNRHALYRPAFDEIADTIKQLVELQNQVKLRRDFKDAGACKIDAETIFENKELYQALLVRSGLFSCVRKNTSEFLIPRKISHLVSDKETSALRCHRDSYRSFGVQTGPIPSPFKLAVFLTHTGRKNGMTGLSSFFKDWDFNNRYLDTIVASLMTPFAHFYEVTPGSAILFDGRLMHYRPKHVEGPYRSVIILSLSRKVGDIPREEETDSAYFGLFKEAISVDRDYASEIKRLLDNDNSGMLS